MHAVRAGAVRVVLIQSLLAKASSMLLRAVHMCLHVQYAWIRAMWKVLDQAVRVCAVR